MAGTIDISQLKIPPGKHELATARFFADRGKDIVFIKPSNIPDHHRPDFIMDGIEWEIKSPTGKGKRTIEKNYSKAASQSKNIIFDLRRINVPEKECLSQLKREFEDKHTRCFLIIKRNGELLKLSC